MIQGYLLEEASPTEGGEEEGCMHACIEEARFFEFEGFIRTSDAPRAGAMDRECC